MRHSDAVLHAVLDLSGRERLSAMEGVLGLRDRLQEVVDLIDRVSLH
jgi:hypothetical protein